jgi:hypothetical protein
MAKGAEKNLKTQRLAEIGIDAICERLQADESYQSIADSLGISQSYLITWVNTDSERSARARAARAASAQTNDDLALQAIKSLPLDATPAQVAQMREEVQHRRWRASKRNPKEYGDKLELAGDPNAPLTITVVKFSDTE